MISVMVRFFSITCAVHYVSSYLLTDPHDSGIVAWHIVCESHGKIFPDPPFDRSRMVHCANQRAEQLGANRSSPAAIPLFDRRLYVCFVGTTADEPKIADRESRIGVVPV